MHWTCPRVAVRERPGQDKCEVRFDASYVENISHARPRTRRRSRPGVVDSEAVRRPPRASSGPLPGWVSMRCARRHCADAAIHRRSAASQSAETQVLQQPGIQHLWWGSRGADGVDCADADWELTGPAPREGIVFGPAHICTLEGLRGKQQVHHCSICRPSSCRPAACG